MSKILLLPEIACIDPHQTGFVDKGSDHLQLITFRPSRAPGKGVCGGDENFWLHLTTASVQCLRLSERFFHSALEHTVTYHWHSYGSCSSHNEQEFTMPIVAY